MSLTPYHAKYFAHELTRLGGTGVERLGRVSFRCLGCNCSRTRSTRRSSR